MDVAILGAGLDGLLAAWAVSNNGYTPAIFDTDEDGENYYSHNAQYLRQPIPGLTDNISSEKITTSPNIPAPYSTPELKKFAINYHRKVYNENDFDTFARRYELAEYNDACSIDDELCCYSVEDVFDELWDYYDERVQIQWLSSQWYVDTKFRCDYDLVINTLPMPRWCKGFSTTGHKFPSIYYWSSNEAPFGPLKSGTILLTSNHDQVHYLQANLFGHWTVHWPERSKPPIPGIEKMCRPLGKDCTCDKVLDFVNIGQLANWDHTIPIHNSYFDVMKLIAKLKSNPFQLKLEI